MWNDRATSAAIQSDGKILVSGYTNNGNINNSVLVRYTISGSLDSTFNMDGKITTVFGTNDDKAFSVVIQSDEKIIVAGTSENTDSDFMLARYSVNGILDSSFGIVGKVITDVEGDTG